MLARSIVALLLLWLPLQGFAAVAMPFCRHAVQGQDDAVHVGAATHGSHSGHSEHGAGHSPAAMDGLPDTGSALSCNDCGACNLACAPAVLPSPALVVQTPAPADRLAGDPAKPRAFNPEQPKRPPLLRG